MTRSGRAAGRRRASSSGLSPLRLATAGSTFASSARRSAIVRPGASRAKTETLRIDGRVLGSSVGNDGEPELRARLEAEAGWHDADDGVVRVAQLHVGTDHARVLAELRLPELVAQHRRERDAESVVLRGESSADHGRTPSSANTLGETTPPLTSIASPFRVSDFPPLVYAATTSTDRNAECAAPARTSRRRRCTRLDTAGCSRRRDRSAFRRSRRGDRRRRTAAARRRTASMTLKAATLAPMAIASDPTAVTRNPGLRSSDRSANRSSCGIETMRLESDPV